MASCPAGIPVFLRFLRCAVSGFALLWPTIGHAQQASLPVPGGDAALALAQTLFARGQWAAADAQLRQYLAVRPDSGEALYLLASTLFRENKPRESLQTYNRAAQARRPTAADLRFAALDYVLLNDYTEADRWITRAARGDPRDGETWYSMGRIKYTENRFAESVDAFRRALECMPRSVKAENNLGLALEGLNHPEDATAAYRQALAWQAGDPHPSEQPFINLGILLTNRNQFDEALPLLERAEALAPKEGSVHESLGKLYARRGDLAKAQGELEQAVAAKPGDAGLHFQLGQVLRKEGQRERAAEELSRASRLEDVHNPSATK